MQCEHVLLLLCSVLQQLTLGVAEDSKPCVRVACQQTRHKTPSGFCEHGGTALATLFFVQKVHPWTFCKRHCWQSQQCLQNCVAILGVHPVPRAHAHSVRGMVAVAREKLFDIKQFLRPRPSYIAAQDIIFMVASTKKSYHIVDATNAI